MFKHRDRGQFFTGVDLDLISGFYCIVKFVLHAVDHRDLHDDSRGDEHGVGLALFDVEDGQYVSAAARLSKALDVGRKMGSPWWNGITLYITWKIRLLLEKQAINVPELSALWPQDKRKHCIECLDCLHRLEPRTETAEMEQALEALNAEKAES